MVRSSRFSGTRQAAWGRVASAMATIASVAAISKLSGTPSFSFSAAMSPSRIWRRSSRRCAVMPSAPRLDGEQSRTHRIGIRLAAGVADRGDVVDIHAEALVFGIGHCVSTDPARSNEAYVGARRGQASAGDDYPGASHLMK